jgi:hypothetical protein
MSQLKNVADVFGEVNVYPAGGKTRVVATILMEPHKEGAQTGIALDGSGSMSMMYGITFGGPVSSVFGKKTQANEITPVAQKICAYLARKVDADGGTTCIYWATGPGGGKVEEIGDFRAEEAEQHTFGPPKQFGTGTQLLPAVKYFVERFKDAPWGFYVFITDGELHDLDDVKAYTAKLAREITAGLRNPLKFVLIGIGKQINEKQMEELDDLDTGTNVDLWDHKLSEELTRLEQIFAEVVDENARVAERGRILDPNGKVIRDYSDVGVPAKLEFEVPAGTQYFTLEVNNSRINQGLSDTATVPPSQIASGVTATPRAKSQPAAAPAQPQQPANLDNLDEVLEAEPAALGDVAEIDATKEATDADWLGFDLEMEKDKDLDIDLKKDDGK